MRALALLALLALLVLASRVAAEDAAPAAASARPDHVVVLVIDGPRWSETWGEPERRQIPHRAHDLAPQGMLWMHAQNAGPTYTNAGHTAMATGFYQEIDNSGRELPAHPGVFQYYLKASGAAATDAWVVASKDKLEVLADTTDPAWHGTFRPSTDCGRSGLGSGYRDDAETMRHVHDILTRHHPHLMLINLKEPDASGHTGDWEAYLRGIRSTDEYAAQLWEWLRADPVYAGHTAYFITNDHGRHLDGVYEGFQEHGCSCEGCRHIELLALGLARGTSDRPRDQLDLAVTIAALVGVRLDGSGGHLLDEAFAAEPAKP
jgi:hypothetical protein